MVGRRRHSESLKPQEPAFREEALADVHGVLVLHWNPPSGTRRRPDRWLLRKRMDNFGDLLGPLIAERIVDNAGVAGGVDGDPKRRSAVGAILHLTRPGDVVWGSGLNGQDVERHHEGASLDIRAVRGPRTRDFLLSKGAEVPEVYGDPALLLPTLFPELSEWATEKEHDVTVVPNLWEASTYERRYPELVVNPQRPLNEVLRRIAVSKMVVGSSLHGLILAEALGIPARLVKAEVDPLLKYEDYYLGTGRDVVEWAPTVEDAIDMGGAPAPQWSADKLIESFPLDLWR